jgi:YD repeat-containing protein
VSPAPLISLLVIIADLGWVVPSRSQTVADRGTLDILQGGTLIGREEFVVRPGRGGAVTGYTITTSAVYPADRPRRRLVAVIEFEADSTPAASQFQSTDGEEVRVVMRFGPRRVTVRTMTPGGESAREHPGGPRAVIVDDSLFAPHALLPGGAASARAFALHGGPGRDLLIRATAEPRRQVTLTIDGDVRVVSYDGSGRLIRVEMPARQLVAVRRDDAAP